MLARSTRPPVSARLGAYAATAVLAAGTALLGTSPALAATTPTLSGPASTVGFGPVTLTGTAAPNASVRLIEAAYIYRGDMNPAVPYSNGDIITTTANSSGHFTLRRTMDSGFVFAAEADGLRSNVITISMVAKPSLQLSASGGNVTVNVHADPAQPWLPVAIQRQEGSSWATLAEGYTLEDGSYATVLTGQTGTHYYRAAVGPDAANAVLVGHTAVVSTGGTVVTPAPTTTPPTTRPPATTPPTTTPPTTTPPTTRPPTTTPPTTTPPTTRPPTTAPPTTTPPTTTPPTTPPAPAGPKAGDVQFTLVQYNPPGPDTNSNSSLVKEYWRITNKSKGTINFKYWTVKDRAGNTYRFPAFLLTPGRSVTIATGKGSTGKPAGYRYWGRTSHVLNNTGDALYLRTGSGKLIDSCSWGNGSGRTSC